MDVERDASICGCRLEFSRSARVPDLGTLPRLRIAEEELRQGCATSRRLGDGINLVAVATYLQRHEFDPRS
jgi:hypothetical protein